jgi:hypothetical protein
MKGYLPLIVLATLAMTSCAASTVAPGSGSTDQQGAEETTSFVEREKEEALNPDAKTYAKDFGVSVEEADRRLDLQDDVGSLGAKLEKNEPDTFAGLESRHKPDYHVVVYFIPATGRKPSGLTSRARRWRA